MILVDTSVWIEHFRKAHQPLTEALLANEVLIHPFILGELALGSFSMKDKALPDLARLPKALRATDDEVLQLIANRKLQGSGIGYVDAHILASALLMPGSKLWTRDQRLTATAVRLGLRTA